MKESFIPRCCQKRQQSADKITASIVTRIQVKNYMRKSVKVIAYVNIYKEKYKHVFV